jgi:hypothetical protein
MISEEGFNSGPLVFEGGRFVELGPKPRNIVQGSTGLNPVDTF